LAWPLGACPDTTLRADGIYVTINFCRCSKVILLDRSTIPVCHNFVEGQTKTIFFCYRGDIDLLPILNLLPLGHFHGSCKYALGVVRVPTRFTGLAQFGFCFKVGAVPDQERLSVIGFVVYAFPTRGAKNTK
jgi:hypothetical protein